jgi:adenylate cyclase
MTRRHWRLGSGVVLWIYIAWHLFNHGLGLVSLNAAEQGLRIAVAAWHSLPGTFLLYGAFTTHIVLALHGLYQRHTLQLPPLELLRIAFGLSIPLLLIAHAVTTRAAFEMYGLAPQYERVVWLLANSGSEGRQLSLLAPGWLHGCMGLHVALRHRAFYQHWRSAYFAFVVVLPLLAAAGFLTMGHDVGVLAQDPHWRTSHLVQPDAAQTQALAQLRGQLLYGYAGLIALLVVARGLRALRRPSP